jgi:hypothetical protein
MHAAGAAGAIVAIGDCGSASEPRAVFFYGAACIDGSCGVIVTDSGVDANDANFANDTNIGIFYGAPCIDGSCLPPEDTGTGAPDASTDSEADSGDAVTSDTGGDGP